MAKSVVQRACTAVGLPAAQQFARWVAVAAPDTDCEVTVRLVDEPESRRLNRQWRGVDCATNVLSFPAFDSLPDLPDAADVPLGDLVICVPLVQREAVEQRKAEHDHWAHMVIHGVLHLLGHDHQGDSEAAEMEALEVRLLAACGVADPYLEGARSGTLAQETVTHARTRGKPR